MGVVESWWLFRGYLCYTNSKCSIVKLLYFKFAIQMNWIWVLNMFSLSTKVSFSFVLCLNVKMCVYDNLSIYFQLTTSSFLPSFCNWLNISFEPFDLTYLLDSYWEGFFSILTLAYQSDKRGSTSWTWITSNLSLRTLTVKTRQSIEIYNGNSYDMRIFPNGGGGYNVKYKQMSSGKLESFHNESE